MYKNKRKVYRGEDCMKKFCESLREHALNIINFEKKNIIPLTNEQLELHEKIKICYISNKSFNMNTLMIKTIVKLTILIIQVNTDWLHITCLV